MCNRQTCIIVVTTVTVSLLLVTTAILVYHFLISWQVKEINDLEDFINEFHDELSVSKDVDSSNCKCVDPGNKCGEQIIIPQFLQSQRILFCPDTYIICCDIKDQLGLLFQAYEDTEMDTNTDDLTNYTSKKENKTMLDVNISKFNLLNKSLENLIKEGNDINETLSEENVHIKNILSNSNNFMHSEGINDILRDIIKEQNNENYKDLMDNEDNGSTDYKNIEQITDEYDYRNRVNNNHVDNDENINSTFDINLIRKTFNDKINFNPEENDEEYDTLMEIINKEVIDRSEHNESQNVFTHEFNPTEEEYTLFDMMDEMGMFEEIKNLSRHENFEEIKNLSRYENFENIKSNQIDDDTNLYNKTHDSYTCSGDHCTQNNQENKNVSNTPESNNISDDSDIFSSFTSLFDLNDIDAEIGFLLPLIEQDTPVNTTALTLFKQGTPKSTNIKDHLFYYTYLTAAVYVVGFLVDFLIPVFSLAGLAVLQFFIYAFPKIIQSQTFDLLSPFLMFMYSIFGLV